MAESREEKWRESLRELEEKQPIRRGGLRAFLFVLTIFFVGLVVYAWFDYVLSDMSEFSSLAVIPTLAVVCGIPCAGVFACVLLCTGSPATWWKEYWQRNVRGYDLMCWKDGEQECFRTVASWAPRKLGGVPAQTLVIFLTFGGWRGSLGVVWWHRGDGAIDRLVGWHVKRHGRVNSSDPFRSKVSLADSDNQSLVIHVDTALNFFRYRSTSTMEDYRWGTTVLQMLADIKRLQGARFEARRQADKFEALLARALAVIESAVDELDGSKRFIKSKAAQGLRERLVKEFLWLLSKNDPRRNRFEKKSAVIKTKKRSRSRTSASA